MRVENEVSDDSLGEELTEDMEQQEYEASLRAQLRWEAMNLHWHQVSVYVTFSSSSWLSSIDKAQRANEWIDARCTDIWEKAHASELLSNSLSLRFYYEAEQFANLQIIWDFPKAVLNTNSSR